MDVSRTAQLGREHRLKSTGAERGVNDSVIASSDQLMELQEGRRVSFDVFFKLVLPCSLPVRMFSASSSMFTLFFSPMCPMIHLERPYCWVASSQRSDSGKILSNRWEVGVGGGFPR